VKYVGRTVDTIVLVHREDISCGTRASYMSLNTQIPTLPRSCVVTMATQDQRMHCAIFH